MYYIQVLKARNVESVSWSLDPCHAARPLGTPNLVMSSPSYHFQICFPLIKRPSEPNRVIFPSKHPELSENYKIAFAG